MARKQVGAAPSASADLVTKGYVDAATSSIPVANISATGTASSSTYLRGDGTWSTVQAGVTTGKAIAMAMVFG